MSSTKKRIYVSALALAIVGFVIDRFVLSSPDSVRAALIGSYASSVDDKPRNEKTNDKDPILFPPGLKSVEHYDASRNPFGLPEPLARRRAQRLSGGKTATQGARRPGEPLTVVQFMTVHELTSVMVNNPGSVIIDDVMVTVGQKFDASELLKVESGKALFQCSDGIAEMVVHD